MYTTSGLSTRISKGAGRLHRDSYFQLEIPSPRDPMLELLHQRLIPFPRSRVFDALADVQARVQWWGPDGFTSTSLECDPQPGGIWRVVLHGPDGTDYPNVYRFLEIHRPEKMVIEHPDPAHWFELCIRCDEAPGGTLLSWRQRFNSEEHCAAIREFVAAANEQVLARLEKVVASTG